jgi:hypothetical protein
MPNTPPGTSRSRKDPGPAPAKKQKKGKQQSAVAASIVVDSFDTTGHAEGVKVFSEDRSAHARALMSAAALEPRIVEADAAGGISSRKLVELTREDAQKLLSVGKQFLTAPVSLVLIKTLGAFDEDAPIELRISQ